MESCIITSWNKKVGDPVAVGDVLFAYETDKAAFEEGKPFFARLAWASDVEITDTPDTADMVSIVTESARLFIPMGELVDREKERARLQKELAAAEKDYNAVSAKLQNQGFLAKAPANVVEAEKARAAALAEKIEKLKSSL